jgi:hypothetical protein
MKAIRIYLIVFCALGLSGGSLLLSAAPSTNAITDKDVVITNTTANPVPVAIQGTASVTGNVNVANMPNVKIANSPTVQLNNSASSPLLVRDVDNPTRQAFQKDVTFTVDRGLNLCYGIAPVPSGKRLVIEYASLEAHLDGDETVPFASLALFSPGGGQPMFQLDVQQTADPHAYRVAQQLRIYSDPDPDTVANHPISFCVQVDGTSGGSASVTAGISGYLVDVP